MTEKNSAEMRLSAHPEGVWVELDPQIRSHVIMLLLQTAFEVVAGQTDRVIKDELNEHPDTPRSQSPGPAH